MTQQEKAKELLTRLFRGPRNYRVGLSEKYLRTAAQNQWVGENERLLPDALLTEAERQVAAGALKKFRRGSTFFYSPKKR